MVGRPREFDVDTVLNAAMQAFWAKGYEATSLADLMAATGLHKGSLYQAFGDKHALFIQSLKRYLEEIRRQKNALLAQAATPLDGLHAVTHALIDMADGDSDCPKGCLAMNTMSELAPHDAEAKQVVAEHLQQMRSSFITTVAEGQAAGQIGKNRTPEEITTMMMTFMAGLLTTMKGFVSTADAHKLLDAQLEAVM
jgi:TetR/AcrR family transcriptional repressor of nem operon